MFNHPMANGRGKQFADRAMNRRRGGKRPAFSAFAPNDLGDMFGQLFANPSIGLGLERRPLGDRIRMAPIAIADRKTPGLIGQLFVITPVGVGDIKGLN
jgi:hypothetical protein